MKKCPYCAEEIQDEAVLCKHCGEMLTAAAPPPPPSEKVSQPPQGRKLLVAIIPIVLALFFLGKLVSEHNSGPTKEEWKAKLAGQNQAFAVAGVLHMRKSDFLQLMGEPDRTQTVGTSVYWYFKCSDGTIQIDLNAPALNAVGIMQGHVSDY